VLLGEVTANRLLRCRKDRQPPAASDVAAADESGRPTSDLRPVLAAKPTYVSISSPPCSPNQIWKGVAQRLQLTISLLQFGWKELCINLLQFLPLEFHVSFMSIKYTDMTQY